MKKLDTRLMQYLRTGPVSNQELAVWFNVQPDSIRGAKPVYLKRLSKYCWFEDIPGGVNILQLKFM